MATSNSDLNVQDILDNFVFRNQIPRLSKANALGTLIERLTSPDVNLSPAPVKHTDGSVRHPGIDNQGIGSYQTDSVKVGYEISFTRYFYKPKPMRTRAEIRADILETETETEVLLEEIFGVGEPAYAPELE